MMSGSMSETQTLPHFPVLRAGKEYKSLDTAELANHRDGTPVAQVSQANAGLIRRDLRKMRERAEVLRAVPIAELIERCQAAARLFTEETLPLGEDAGSQSPEEYVQCLSSTSGLPETLARGNMEKVALVLREMPTILRGLMRGMAPEVLDGGLGEHDGIPVWYTPNTDSLGVILPSNSPGVNSLWIPSIALKVPVVLKPGREEPWTPMRVARAMIAAGIPAEAFSMYPTDHEGSATILERCGRALLFGDVSVTDAYKNDPSVEIHGPGRSKVILGADEAANWRDHLDVIVDSVAANGGRSCVNASSIFVPSHADELADALARRLAKLEPTAHDDPEAKLAAFANPAVADGIDAAIARGLEAGGAEDVTAKYRSGERRAEVGGAAFLRPTVIRCASVDNPLANTEYLFPFTSVVEVPQERMLDTIGPSLVVTAITRDPRFVKQLTASPAIHRLNLGPVPTSRVEWNQPHEGNLFEFLYTRRALQRATDW